MYNATARLLGNSEPSADVETFLSTQNVKSIQRRLTRVVYDATEHRVRIDDQPETDIKMCMIDFVNRDDNISRPLSELNSRFIEKCSRIVLGNVSQYLHYMRDIQGASAGRVPEALLGRPSSTRADKSLLNPRPF